MFCRFCVCFFFDICLPYVVSHVHRAGRVPAPYPCSFAILPLSTLIFVVFAIRSAFWSHNNNNNKTQHLLLVCNLSLFRRFAVASSSEMESIKKTQISSAHSSPRSIRDFAESAARNKCQLRRCELLLWRRRRRLSFPLTLPLLYDDNKSRKATTTTTRRTETQLGQLSVYIIDRPLLATPPHLSPTRRSVCLRDFFLTLVWCPPAHVPGQTRPAPAPVSVPAPAQSLAQPIPSSQGNLLSLLAQKYRKETMKTVKKSLKNIVTNRCSTWILNIYLYFNGFAIHVAAAAAAIGIWVDFSSRGFYRTPLSAPRSPRPICFQQIPRTVPSAVTYWPIQRGQCAPFPISLRSRQAFHLPSISTQKGFFIFAHSTQKSPGPASIIAMANRRTCGMCNMQYGSIKHKFHNIFKTTINKVSI